MLDEMCKHVSIGTRTRSSEAFTRAHKLFWHAQVLVYDVKDVYIHFIILHLINSVLLDAPNPQVVHCGSGSGSTLGAESGSAAGTSGM